MDSRRLLIASHFADSKLEALLITHAPNVRYLTGYTGSNGLLLLFPGGDGILFTDPRYALQAPREADCRVKIVRGPLIAAAAKTIAARRLRRIGFEKTHLSWRDHNFLADRLPRTAALEPSPGWVEDARMIKSTEEIAAIRRSVATNSQAYSNTLKRIRAGVKETEVAAELDYQMRRLGAEKSAFDTIVAAGERTALPHAQPTPHALGAGELLLIDMGCCQGGYCSDMTRMAFLGAPGRKVKNLYHAVLEAQLAGIDAVKENATAGSVDRAARKILEQHGLDKQFVHSTGHGLGLEIHEPPRLGRREKTPLKPGMVVTIEPGVYVEGSGGIRIEDTVLVTANGCVVLTPSAKDLVSL